MSKIFLICLFFILNISPLQSKDQPQDLDTAQKQLELIRHEIDKLEDELVTMENKLNWQLKTSEKLDKQIQLTKKALRIIQSEIKANNKTVNSLTIQITALEAQIDALQDVFRKQIVFAYKQQRGKELLWILGSENINQAFTRYRNFQRISEQARSYYQKLQTKQHELLKLKLNFEDEVTKKKELAKSKENEQLTFNSKRNERQDIINSIKNDKSLLAQALEQKKENYKELLNLIASLEAGKKDRKLSPETQIRWEKLSGDFDNHRGRLNWPVAGQVIHAFGTYKNPQLKTVLNNTGIDIRAGRGTEVRCVFPGVVSLITYMSGFGNTVIVDHNNSYYTVYTHLDDILVNKFQFLEAGDVLGIVGASGSLEGSLLHFEIYGKNKPLDPMKWLIGK
jgi:septal ring factor EnvC (AmiA/AmiB activator)